jgi:hypothetical protein
VIETDGKGIYRSQICHALRVMMMMIMMMIMALIMKSACFFFNAQVTQVMNLIPPPPPTTTHTQTHTQTYTHRHTHFIADQYLHYSALERLTNTAYLKKKQNNIHAKQNTKSKQSYL